MADLVIWARCKKIRCKTTKLTESLHLDPILLRLFYPTFFERTCCQDHSWGQLCADLYQRLYLYYFLRRILFLIVDHPVRHKKNIKAYNCGFFFCQQNAVNSISQVTRLIHINTRLSPNTGSPNSN